MKVTLGFGIALLALSLLACEGGESNGTDGGGVDDGGLSGIDCSKGALSQSVWKDLGNLPEHVHDPVRASIHSLARTSSMLLAGTADGVFVRPTNTDGPWLRAGLEGKLVQALVVPDPSAPVVIAGLVEGTDEGSLYRSTDHGQSWEPLRDALMDEAFATYDVVEDFTIVPGTTTVLANTAGGSIARSTDLGASWTYVIGVPGSFGYACVSTIALDATSTLLQGCELPLDDAWVATYDLAAKNPNDTFQKIITSDVLGNRRPNRLAVSAAGRVYAGVEGGLAVFDPSAAASLQWIFKSGDPAPDRRYTYIRSIWIDQCDDEHVVFAGQSQADNTILQIYETFDEGAILAWIAPPTGITGDEYFTWASVLGATNAELILGVESRTEGAPSQIAVYQRTFSAP